MVINLKLVEKNDQKLAVINVKNRCRKWVVINWSKSGQKMIKIGGVKSMPKTVKNCHAMGGSKIIKNRLFWVWGPRGPIYGIFWNFAVFYKSSPLFDPQNRPPKRALLKMPFPTNRLYFCSNGGSENVTFWGVGGRTARTEKCRHYYIAIFAFWHILGPPIFDNFDLADPPS
jgi:hypothetical protein